MTEADLKVSFESLPALEPYAALPLADPRRVELFSFLADAVVQPRKVAFEADEQGLRWTFLAHVGLVSKLNLPREEIDVIDVWDEGA